LRISIAKNVLSRVAVETGIFAENGSNMGVKGFVFTPPVLADS